MPIKEGTGLGPGAAGRPPPAATALRSCLTGRAGPGLPFLRPKPRTDPSVRGRAEAELLKARRGRRAQPDSPRVDRLGLGVSLLGSQEMELLLLPFTP